jgi:hypothetical protein
MPTKLTYTGGVGPGNSVTSLVFNNVIDLEFDFNKKVIIVTYLTTGGINPLVQTLDLNVLSTINWTTASGVGTITMS